MSSGGVPRGLVPARYWACAGRVVTCDAQRATVQNPLGVLEDGAMLVHGDTIEAVVPRPAAFGEIPVLADDPGGVLSPGLCDAHTHAAWVGSRHGEYVRRLQGESYEAIAAAGGGIRASMRALREADDATRYRELRQRLRRMAQLGVTTVEVKSGYGLSAQEERRILEVVSHARADSMLPRVVPTYLALHAVPPEFVGGRDRYIEQALALMPELSERALAHFADAYLDRGAFDVEEGERLCLRAREAGLGIRLHAGQFADIGGADLGARFSASSVDHLEHVGEWSLAAMAAAGTRAVLLPVASFTLGQPPPPVATMRKMGVPLVVASDANPGTAPTDSLPLAMSLAVRLYGLTPEEAWLGATRESAASLELQRSTGSLQAGLQADWVLWDFCHEWMLLQPWGTSRTRMVVRGSVVLWEQIEEESE